MDRKQSDPRELLLMIFNVSLKTAPKPLVSAELSADRCSTQIDNLLNEMSKITQ